MSTSAAATTLRELGAQKRTFRGVRQALLWYRDQLALRLRVNRDPAGIGTPRSQDATDQVAATFAAIANCLKRRHASDPEDQDDADGVRWLVSGERVSWLVASYEARWGDNTWLADRAGLSRWTFTRLCRRTERVLRVRMEWARLLDGEEAI